MQRKIAITVAELTASILVFGLIKLVLFYKNYNISIIYYLQLSDIPLLISEDLIFIVPFVLLLIGAFFIFLWYIRNGKFVQKEALRKFNQIIPYAISILFAILIIGRVLYRLIYPPTTYGSKISNYCELICWCSIAFVFIFHKFFIKVGMSITHAFLFTFVMYLVVLVGGSANQNIIDINRGKYFGTKIIKSDTTYSSDQNHTYIGKTTNYTFIYNAYDTTALIIPNEKIEMIYLKEKSKLSLFSKP